MNNINMNHLLEKLDLENQIVLEDIPHIDLYMDQVIQLFENKFNASKRNEEEKVLTKTMINNYAKGKLIFPIKKKKYSKEHILLISLIYQLKGSLSINDIKTVLEDMNEGLADKSFDLEAFYCSYLSLMEKNAESFRGDLMVKADDVQVELNALGGKETNYIEKVLMIGSLVNMSNFYRKAAEKLVDELKVGTKKEKA